MAKPGKTTFTGIAAIKIIGHPSTNEEMAKTGGLSSIHPEVGGYPHGRSRLVNAVSGQVAVSEVS